MIRTDTDERKGLIRRRRHCDACGFRFTVSDPAPERGSATTNQPISAAQAGRVVKRSLQSSKAAAKANNAGLIRLNDATEANRLGGEFQQMRKKYVDFS